MTSVAKIQARTQSKFQAVLFDCDGVLVDSEAMTNQVICDTLNTYGASIDLASTMQQFLGRSLRENAPLVASLIGKPAPESFFTDFLRDRDAALAARVQAIAGVEDVLKALVAANIPFAVASGADVHKMGITLGRTGLLKYFQGRMFGSDHVTHSKPDPAVYLYAAKALGVDPAQCAVVEDTPTGTRAGLAAGATVFGYAEHNDANALLAAGAAAVIRDMRYLPALLGL